MSGKKHYVTPFVMPVAAFFAAIIMGAVLLSLELTANAEPASFVDALFISTSAVCVTGLATVDVFAVFNRGGQCVILALIQLGGLGIITYATLIFYMLGKRISLRDRLAVEQGLLYNPTFHLGRLLQRMVLTVFTIEAVGAACLYIMEPERIGPFNAVFIAVSAFCNAGFAPWTDNLIQWRSHLGMNLTVMLLIVFGGIGFFVFDDIFRLLQARWRALRNKSQTPYAGWGNPWVGARHLSYYSRVVLKTTLFLIVGGWLVLFLLETGNAAWKDTPLGERLLATLFQSVTCRTAGFATEDMARFSDAALLISIMLMFIGGSPGSCAGGIKTTSFRVLFANLIANLRGHSQVIVDGRAMSANVLNKVVLLLSYAMLTVMLASFALILTENSSTHHGAAAVPFLDIVFEAVSAFGTVGLSVNLTPHLSSPGKLILCLLMFIGRLGPIWLVTTIQQFQSEPAYRYPEDSMPIG